MRGERAYWCFRGKFYARAVFLPGEGSDWVLISAGKNLYRYTFSGGYSIPGRVFRGEVLCGGKLYATTPVHIEYHHSLTVNLRVWNYRTSIYTSWHSPAMKHKKTVANIFQWKTLVMWRKNLPVSFHFPMQTKKVYFNPWIIVHCEARLLMSEWQLVMSLHFYVLAVKISWFEEKRDKVWRNCMSSRPRPLYHQTLQVSETKTTYATKGAAVTVDYTPIVNQLRAASLNDTTAI